jgi:hypothetical protein
VGLAWLLFVAWAAALWPCRAGFCVLAFVGKANVLQAGGYKRHDSPTDGAPAWRDWPEYPAIIPNPLTTPPKQPNPQTSPTNYLNPHNPCPACILYLPKLYFTTSWDDDF